MELPIRKGLQTMILLVKTRSLALLCLFCGFVPSIAGTCFAQSCRPLEQQILYEYDPTHRAYPNSAVVLGLRNEGGGLSITISTTQQQNGRDQVRLLVSKDGGRHWLPFNQRNFATSLALAGNKLAAAPSDPRVQYKYIEKSGVYVRTSDAGATWTIPENRIGALSLDEFIRTSSGTSGYRVRFSIAAVHPSNSLTLFSTIRLDPKAKNRSDQLNSMYMGLYRSEDGAEHWTKVTDVVDYGTPLGIDPTKPSIIFGYGKVGLVGVLKTTDAGNTWVLTKQQRLIEQRPLLAREQHGSPVLGVPVGIAVHQFAVDPSNPRTAYIVSTKGIYRSLDGGEQWCLLTTQRDFIDSVYSLAFDPADTQRIFVGTRFGVLYSEDRGEHFKRVYPPNP
jgi:photosystem II stability/assembly factor-like uncharacterized protein